MRKKIVIAAVAKIEMGNLADATSEKLLIHNRNWGFVRFTVQSTGGGSNAGRKLFIFDHRPETLEAAENIFPEEIFPGKKPGNDLERNALAKAIARPARVFVMEKTNSSGYYINLYPANGKKPTALLSMTYYTGTNKSGLAVQKNNSYWNWRSKSFSHPGILWEKILVALTDEEHKISIYRYEYTDANHLNLSNFMVIGIEIQKILA